MTIAKRRDRACQKLLADIHAITDKEGITPSALHAFKGKLVNLARKTELFPLSDFAMPKAQGDGIPLLVEDDDGHGLYLAINLPGKEAAPHDHGVWCINAAVSGAERNQLFRRADDGSVAGAATIEKIGDVLVAPGNGLAMADHDIHDTAVVGREPALILMLYGYAVTRFPSVVWYHPEFGSVRATPSRRHMANV